MFGARSLRDLASPFTLFLILCIESSKPLGFRILHFQVELLVEVRISDILALRRVEKLNLCLNVVPNVFVEVAEVLRLFADLTNIAILQFLNSLASFQNGLLILVAYQPNFGIILENLGKVILNFLSILILI